MQSSPSIIYAQNIDKQRILVVGKNSSRIIQLVFSVLQYNNRKYSCSTPTSELQEDTPFIIIEPPTKENLLEYKHHILILCDLSEADQRMYSTLADATPKSGAIIFNESDRVSSEIGKVQRADVAATPYNTLKHEMQNGQFVLITSTNEKIITSFSDLTDIKNCSAAKEFVKKIGISSGQFYRAITTL